MNDTPAEPKKQSFIQSLAVKVLVSLVVAILVNFVFDAFKKL